MIYLFNRFLLVLVMSFSVATAWSDSQPNLFKNGALNPAYMGKAASFFAEVIDIKNGPGDKDFYKLNVNRKGVKPIWVSSFANIVKGQIKVGDRLKFIGHVRKCDDLDPSGKLKQFVQSDALLIARSIQSVK